MILMILQEGGGGGGVETVQNVAACQTDGEMAQSVPPFLLFKRPPDFLELVKPGLN